MPACCACGILAPVCPVRAAYGARARDGRGSTMSDKLKRNGGTAVWDWRREKRAAPEDAAGRRKRAAIEAAVGFAAALTLAFGFHHRVAGGIVLGIAALVLVGGLWFPPLYHGFRRFGALLGKWVGAALTWALLVPFFYLCFAPARLLLALTGRDPMRRRFDPSAPSYWTSRKRTPMYTRQF